MPMIDRFETLVEELVGVDIQHPLLPHPLRDGGGDMPMPLMLPHGTNREEAAIPSFQGRGPQFTGVSVPSAQSIEFTSPPTEPFSFPSFQGAAESMVPAMNIPGASYTESMGLQVDRMTPDGRGVMARRRLYGDYLSD